MSLAPVAHVAGQAECQMVRTASPEIREQFGPHVLDQIADLLPLHIVKRFETRPRRAGDRRRLEQADSGADTGARHDQDVLHAEMPGKRGGMHRSGATAYDDGKIARIQSAFENVDARCIRHGLDDDAKDRLRRRVDIDRLGTRDGHRYRLGRGLGIQGKFAADQPVRIQVSEHEAGVGNGRRTPAAAITGRAGIAAGAVRSDLDQPETVDPRNAATARADLDQVDGGGLDRDAAALLEPRIARHFIAAGQDRLAVEDDRGLGRGAAHVESQHLRPADPAGDTGRGEDSGRRAALQQFDRAADRRLHAQTPAVGRDEMPWRADAALLQQPVQAPDIAGNPRAQIGIGDSCRSSFVFADFRAGLVRQHNRPGKARLAQDLADARFMNAVPVTVQQADRDGLDARIGEFAGELPDPIGIERRFNGAVGVEPLFDLEPQTARHQRHHRPDRQVVEVVARLPPEFEDIAETFGRDQRDARPASLDQCVRRLGGRVYQRGDHAGFEFLSVQEGPDSGGGAEGDIRRIRRHFRGTRYAAIGIEQHEVGERAADIEAQAIAAPARSLCRRGCHRVAVRKAASAARSVNSISRSRWAVEK